MSIFYELVAKELNINMLFINPCCGWSFYWLCGENNSLTIILQRNFNVKEVNAPKSYLLQTYSDWKLNKPFSILCDESNGRHAIKFFATLVRIFTDGSRSIKARFIDMTMERAKSVECHFKHHFCEYMYNSFCWFIYMYHVFMVLKKNIENPLFRTLKYNKNVQIYL